MAFGVGAILYKGRNYSDTAVKLGPGRYEDIATASGMPRGAVSSIKVAAFTAVTLYSERVFGGKSIRIQGPDEIPDLSRYSTGFDDKTASVIVESTATPATLLRCCTTPGMDKCGDYVAGSPMCEKIVGDHCVANIGSPYCQQWCRKNTERCDSAVIAWCAKNPNDPYCTCINSKAGKIANPKCVDAKCIRTGYMTTGMERTACPDIIDCSIRAKLINNGVSLATIVPIQQNCGGTSDTQVTTSQDIPPATTASPSMTILILLFFVVLVAIALAIYVLGDDSPPVSAVAV